MTKCSILVTDTGPLKTLAYANQLDLLLRTNLDIHITDMVIEELKVRDLLGNRIALEFIAKNEVGDKRQITVVGTGVPAKAERLRELGVDPGEHSLKLLLNDYANSAIEKYALFLFEDYDIAKKTFVLPDNVYLLTTRAFLLECEDNKLIASAEDALKQAEKVSAENGDSRSLLNRKRETNEPPKRNRSVRPF